MDWISNRRRRGMIWRTSSALAEPGVLIWKSSAAVVAEAPGEDDIGGGGESGGGRREQAPHYGSERAGCRVSLVGGGGCQA
jgi:hypothetical protein